MTKKWGRDYKCGDVAGYESLASTLQAAYNQAAIGKGKVRHAEGKDFEKQDICEELRIFGSISPALFQARKKIKETLRIMSTNGARAELLDAIVYLAAAVIVLDED